jgi:cyclophilin family peptidyl-prolyl cis-trans isomerase
MHMRRRARLSVAAAAAFGWLLSQGAGLAQAPANPVVVLETSKGTITMELYPQDAPKSVEQFMALVKKNFYNRQHFHRVVKGFVIQVGDPDSKDMAKKDTWGRRGSGQPIGVAEISKTLKHKKGAVGMAHAGDAAKADGQFYITLAARKDLDGKYAIIGQVTSGLDVTEKIELGDLVRRMYVQ